MAEQGSEIRHEPMTDYFTMGLYDGQNKDDVRSAYAAAVNRGPQPVGTIDIISGVIVQWRDRNSRYQSRPRHLGGDPGPVKEFNFDKAAAPAGNTPQVRPSAPQIPPPPEEPI